MKEQFLNLTGLTELVGYLKTSIANHKEILPYASNKLFPSVGDINTIYINTATNTIYRWDSSSKTYITLAKAVKSVAISEATENGKITLTVDGNKTTVPIHGLGSAAYTNSSAYSPAGHTHTKAQVGLGNVDNTADANKSVKHATTADSATTAGSATTATNVSGENATGDTARHVWFSRSDSETKRVYNDNFKYNPATNLLTTNITGSAASASNVPWTGVTGKPSTFTPSAHNHNDSTITSLNASKLFGTIDIARLPHGALERLVIVADDIARFKLTTANIQLGDTVKVTKTEKMYYVVDESKLSSEAGYAVYTAGTATSVPWSGVTGKPSSYPPASHNHDERYYTETEMNSKLAEKATKVHTHVKSEVGLGNVDNTADANKSVKYATSAGSSTTSGAISSSGTLDTVAKLDAFIEGGKVKYATVSALDGLNGMIKNDGICISTPWSSTGYGHQFYINDNGYEVYHRFRNTTKVNNVDTTTWSSWKQILDSSNYNIYAPTKTGSGASGTWGISVTGNAATATKLATARSINGTNFDGSGNITTATWGTARNVTIGSTKKSVNGGADVSWSLSEIGAAAVSHSHSYLPLSGGTLTGTAMITWPDSGNWSNSNKNVTFPVVRGGLSWNGQSDGIQLYAVETGNDNLELYLKFSDDNSNGLSIRNKDNAQTARISATGEITASKFVGNLAGTASSASAVPWSGVTGRPSSMPASDVYAWAKASTKPSYSWGEITGKPGTFTPTSHSHSYITASASSSAVPTKAADGRVEFYYNVNNGLANNMPSTNNANAIISLSRHAGDYPSQLGFSSDGNIYYREGVGTTAWKTIITSSNYTSYTTTKTGGGASGTWGINVSGGAAYPTGFNSRDTSATWGNQTGILITDWHTRNGGDIQFRDNSGQLNVITDGFFYQNEGRNLVLDSVNYSNYAATKSHTHNYAGSSSAGGNANAAVKLANARKIGSASFDGTADITLSQMGLNVPVEITKADYLAKKKAGTLNANTYYNVIDEYDSANVINDSSVTANSAFSSTKSEKTYAKKSTLVTTTLTASKWTGSSAPYTYVLPVSGATTSNIVEINYASNASSQAIEAYQNAMLADGGQTTNQITIKATEKPTVDIPITIVIRNDL